VEEERIGQSFIKPGVIEAEYSGIYGAVRDARELSDYDLWFMPVEEFTETIIADAEGFWPGWSGI